MEEVGLEKRGNENYRQPYPFSMFCLACQASHPINNRSRKSRMKLAQSSEVCVFNLGDLELIYN